MNGDTASAKVGIASLGPVTTYVNLLTLTEVNVTDPSHSLYPGAVYQQVYQVGDEIHIQTTGIGDGILPGPNDFLGGMAFSKQDQAIRTLALGGIPPNESDPTATTYSVTLSTPANDASGAFGLTGNIDNPSVGVAPLDSGPALDYGVLGVVGVTSIPNYRRDRRRLEDRDRRRRRRSRQPADGRSRPSARAEGLRRRRLLQHRRQRHDAAREEPRRPDRLSQRADRRDGDEPALRL